jgi:hypothetical protein
VAAATPEDPARVVNIGSIAGLGTSRFDNAYAYAASKAAVAHLTHVLAVQLTFQGQQTHRTIPSLGPHPRAALCGQRGQACAHVAPTLACTLLVLSMPMCACG